jgi:ectoine hydroxylase-related dioxygenase (phytanoyl-CoA dioxygenase family)
MSKLKAPAAVQQEQPRFTLNNQLKADQIRYFEKNGFILFRQFIDRTKVQELLHEIQAVEKFLLETGKTKVNGIPLKFGFDPIREGPFIQRIAFTSQFSPVLSQFLQDPRFALLPRLLNPYTGRIGEDEKDGLVFNHYLNTDESSFNQLGWHTDSPRDLFLGSRIRPMLNVGLHLDDCPRSNGGLRILAGTHKQGTLRLLFRKKYFIDHDPDPEEVGFDIEAGDLTIHDGRTWHRVQRSPFTGERSRRRVMYIPVVTGAYEPKHQDSPTPFYHSIGQLLFSKKIRPSAKSLSGTWANLVK